MAREPHRSSEILDAVALLVVDMQDAFLNVMPDRDAVLRRTALAIEAARAFGIKVIFTEQVPAKLGPTNADLLALAPDARVFAKNEFSALLAEGLQEYLRRINVYHLLIAGIETPICIYQTALHAQDNELDVTILSDCTSGRRAEDCIMVLEALARADCHVLPAETVFYSMLGSSQNPRFGHFTRIVKRYSTEDPIDGTPTPAPEPEHPRHEGHERPERREQHHGGRQGERRGDHGQPPSRPQPQNPHRDEAPRDDVEDTDDLRAEDGISDDEANQPSYEEATAGHSDDDIAGDMESPDVAADQERRRPMPGRSAPKVAEEVTSEAPDAESDSGDEPDGGGDDSDEQTANQAEGDTGEGPRKKRPRRRRGGARRRRARERAAGSAQGSADQSTSDSPSAPAVADAGSEGGSGPAEPSAPPSE